MAINPSAQVEKLAHEVNASGSTLSFLHLSYRVDSKGREGKVLVDDVSVAVKAGELLAIMGPSGAGKSTLLDLMAFRKTPLEGASVNLNGKTLGARSMQQMSTFVEQEDALLGVLPILSRQEVAARGERVLGTLGLQSCANQRIGTPISCGISGGIRILLLDEVTSGLDSTSAREVMSAIRTLAVAEGMIAIATIHQPSLETIAQFTDILLLTEGKTCFSGKVGELEGFLEKWGHPVRKFTTPSDHAMNFLNNDFAKSGSHGDNAQGFREFYLSTNPSLPSTTHDIDTYSTPLESEVEHGRTGPLGTLFWNTVVLSERSRTIWIRLGDHDSTINDRFSVHFFSVAFLAFMSVAGIPGFLEELSVYYRETKNGLYTTLPFLLSNTLVNIPFLFLCTSLFTLISYWAIGLNPDTQAFFHFLAFLYLAILAAESQMLVVASFMPIFVAALAIASFFNGFLSVGGYFIKARSLPRFWYYSFHYMDYQRYAFELLSNSDLRGRSFNFCAYPSSTPDTCTVSGDDVLRYLEIRSISYGKWIAILIAITLIYRIAWPDYTLL
ncbi:P-loop containing nucleoside triphosphate hydrolase protein [Mycena leptocephala]|nr:P-loop containing nucleoside triphosphate hydrolase protein [Mycena leptocephala]